MIAPPGYQLKMVIGETARSTIWRARRSCDDVPVILKHLKRAEPGSDEVACYHREYEILRHLHGVEGIVEAYALEWVGNTLLMSLEDFGAAPLRTLISSGRPDLSMSLDIALRIVRILGAIHAADAIHNALNPDNILRDPETGAVKITGFGNATLLSLENPAQAALAGRPSGFPYISPEQTGRMNRKVDYRSDYYALGATLYELFAGVPPFVSDDPVEIFYAHIAKAPPALHEVLPGFPAALSAIVAKLLEKNAENRYQGAWGILADLEECARQWRAAGRINPFPPAREDVSDRFRIPEKIYGRDAEIATLLESFRRATAGGREFLLVSGYSGIGKTFLVSEVYKPLAKQRGFFISGKFEQFQRNIPYSAFIGAFRGLIRQLLTGSETDLRDWRARLLEAFGSRGRILIDVLPEIELVVGPQPVVSELPPSESKNRFNKLFLEFIRIFPDADRPLVVFIDDLQWADADSLNLIQILLTDQSAGHLFLVCAYRDNEVGAGHPLLPMLETLERQRGAVDRLALSPLSLDSIVELLSDTLRAGKEGGAEDVRPLAQLVARKTGGNPFFVNQFLSTLYQDGLLVFGTAPDGERRWDWNIQTIETRDFTDNVVDLVISKLMRLPQASRVALQLAACVGNRFDLASLAIISQQSPAATYEDLLPVIHQGLIQTASSLAFSKDCGDEASSQLLVHDFRFLHDRVQHAAYALIDDAAKQEVHLRIARLLWGTLDEDGKAARLFEIADHFNKGVNYIESDAELMELVSINSKASRKAKSSTAYDSALRYLCMAMEACPSDCSGQLELLFRLSKERAELEYLNGNYDVADAFLDHTLDLAETDIDRAMVYDLRIIQNTMLGKHQVAIDTGAMALSLLGIELPRTDLSAAIDRELDDVERTLRGREISSLFDAPPMVLPDKIAAMKLLNELTPGAYFYNNDLYSWVLAKMANLSLEFGHTPESGKGYTSFGNVLAYRRDAFQDGYEFGMLGLRLCREINHLGFVCRSCFVATTFLIHWVRPARESEALGEEGYRAGLESGEYLYAGYILAFNNVMNAFFLGRNLFTLQDEMLRRLPFLQQTNNRLALDLSALFLDAIRKLRGEDEAETEPEWSAETSATVVGVCLVVKAARLYIYGRPEEALALRQGIEARRSFLNGTIASAADRFYASLILIACYPTASEDDKRIYREELKDHRKRLEIWARSCPENFAHKLLMVDAETARMDGSVAVAMETYDAAIAAARQSGLVQDEALANELAAMFWLGRNKEDFARLYIGRARDAYRTWGALDKAADLERKFAPILHIEPNASVLEIKANDGVVRKGAALDLDMTAVIRASQAISGEIVLDRLLDKMMVIVMESAGAENGILFLNKEERLIASAAIRGQGKVTRPNIGIEFYDNAPAAIVNYVARTQSEVILDDASGEALFSTDPYIRRNKPKSVLCIPIRSQGALLGILYLENDQAFGAFTTDRVDLLRLISVQAAISLRNADFYASLQASEEKFRQLYENALEGLFESTPEGRIQFANPAMARTLNYSTPGELITSDRNVDNEWFVDPARHRAFLQAIAESGHVADFEALFHRRDGSEVWIAITAQAVRDQTGAITGISGYLLDIGARKEHQAEELKRKEAEAATKAKSQFLANMSHEIRTPMNAIIGLTHLALRSNLTPKQTDYLRKIRGSAQSLLGIINDILDFSKIEAGKMEIERIAFDLHDVMDNLANVVTIKSEEKNIEVMFFFADDVPYHLVGDPLRLGQVLINLATNAVKFTSTGEVVIGVDLIARTDTTVRLKFSVRDTGIGLTAEQRQGLFQSFHQADGSVTRKYGGTGLGLAISRQLVELMDGSLAVESEFGIGSTFYFDATLGIAENEAQIAKVLVPEILLGKTVLVVDDNATSRDILCNILQRFSFAAEAVESGVAAIALLERHHAAGHKPFSLILMDWNMPGMDGIETARRIKSHPGLPPAPAILMVTAYGRDEVLASAMEAGLDGVLTKPVGPSLLLNTVLETLCPGSTATALADRSGATADKLRGIRGAKVLLVEDNSINQMVATEFLRQAGLIVETASNGREGVEMGRSGAYDLILMDVQMPEMDGLEATRRLRALGLTQLPIVAMTAHAMAGDREHSLEAGMNGHLTKPVDPAELEEVLLRWIPDMDRQAPMPSAVLERQPRRSGAPAGLTEIDGLDTELGVMRVGGSAEFYLELLNDFLVGNAHGADRVAAERAIGDNDEAELIVHSIKGAAGSLGATRLVDAAQVLETALRLRDHAKADQAFPAFKRALEDLCAALRDYFAQLSVGVPAALQADAGAALPIIGQLIERLEAGSAKAERSLADLRIVMAGLGLDAELAQMAECIEDVEFTAALDIARRLRVLLTEVCSS